jgi:hypothetical protein
MKRIKFIDTEEIKEITDGSFFIKSDFCKHSGEVVCSKCILFGSYIPKQVLKALDNGEGGLI